MLTRPSCQHKLTGMEKTLELAEGAASNDPEVGLRAVAALRVLVERLEMLQVDHPRALAWIGIDLEAVRARAEAAFGADAFTRAAPDACRGNRPAWPNSPMARLLRRRRRSPAAAGPYASPGAYPTGHLPFTPRAKKSLEHSLREARARHAT